MAITETHAITKVTRTPDTAPMTALDVVGSVMINDKIVDKKFDLINCTLQYHLQQKYTV